MNAAGIDWRVDEDLTRPLRWGQRNFIRVVCEGDLFHENQNPKMIANVFAVMAACPQHIFNLTSKYPNWARKWITSEDTEEQVGWAAYTLYEETGDAAFSQAMQLIHQQGYRHGQYVPQVAAMPEPPQPSWPLPNVWIGATINRQGDVMECLSALMDTPAALRIAACDPLLGPVDLHLDSDTIVGAPVRKLIGWVTVAGEIGRNARPMHPDWVRNIRDQCRRVGVPFCFVNWGDWSPEVPEHRGTRMQAKSARWIWPDGHSEPVGKNKYTVGAALIGNISYLLTGANLDGAPIQELPAARAVLLEPFYA